jgi:phosphatidylserine/phosphatidylglycerophosphate/cardiolipin synthase-like enzyme
MLNRVAIASIGVPLLFAVALFALHSTERNLKQEDGVTSAQDGGSREGDAGVSGAASAVDADATKFTTCFTPGEDCTSEIVSEIDSAQKSLLVQAYEFTSLPIIDAIVRAEQRGVVVRIILDKVNEEARRNGQESIAAHLLARGLSPLIDNRHIAHNKVMVIDGRDVVTGSFNFTAAAQRTNAENVIFIRNAPVIAKSYADNFERRAADSRAPIGTEQ